ncbi:uncharacterized protein phf11 isoform X1 [Vanacampus margaritifer]
MGKGVEILNGHFYFKILPDGEIDKRKAYCRHCDIGLSYHRSTSSLRYHLNALHTVDVRNPYRETTGDPDLWLTPLNETCGITAEKQRHEDLTNAIAKWLATDCRPISVVDDVGLRNVFRIATNDRKYEIPSRHTITKRLHRLYEDERTAKETTAHEERIAIETTSQHASSERQASMSSKKMKIMSDSSSSGDDGPPQILAPIEDSDLDESFNLKPWQVANSQSLLDPEKTSNRMPSTNVIEVKVEKGQEAILDAATFWRHCNMAGCTDAIFSHFLTNMKDVSQRIQQEQASQEDLDVAFKVMMASGKMTQLLRKQLTEMEQKHVLVQKSLAAMQQVMSLLRS